MKEKEFWDCKFLDNGLKFYTFNEFVEDALAMKRLYDEMNPKQIYLYRWYVYAHPNLSMNAKNLFWDFLNDYCPYEQFTLRVKQVKK